LGPLVRAEPHQLCVDEHCITLAIACVVRVVQDDVLGHAQRPGVVDAALD
jgi:hypothetical protein